MCLATGCREPSNSKEVVVYAALDRDFSEPLFREFQKKTGIRVRAKYDTESQKTVGLFNAILSESNRPRCDLFWNNEILNTLRLRERNLLEAYDPKTASDFPERFRDPQSFWFGFAARARVLIVNTQLIDQDQYPSSIEDLADPRWKGKVGIAKPLFGTTATHAAVLFAALGEDQARNLFHGISENAKTMAGNKHVAVAVANGRLHFGITDTDDAIIEREQGMPVEIIYPDQAPGQIGTLFIPNTLALIKGSPQGDNARRLADFLLSPEVEKKLANGPSAQVPLNRSINMQLRVESPKTIRAMKVDFADAASHWDQAARFLRDEFAR